MSRESLHDVVTAGDNENDDWLQAGEWVFLINRAR
jgi:hypothetical protein